MGKIGKGKKLDDNVSVSNNNSIDADFLEGIIFAKEKRNFQEKIYRVDEESKKVNQKYRILLIKKLHKGS